jgi:hypothetical protein
MSYSCTMDVYVVQPSSFGYNEHVKLTKYIKKKTKYHLNMTCLCTLHYMPQLCPLGTGILFPVESQKSRSRLHCRDHHMMSLYAAFCAMKRTRRDICFVSFLTTLNPTWTKGVEALHGAELQVFDCELQCEQLAASRCIPTIHRGRCRRVACDT